MDREFFISLCLQPGYLNNKLLLLFLFFTPISSVKLLRHDKNTSFSYIENIEKSSVIYFR